MRYVITKEIKSETKVFRNLFLKDFFFLIGYGALSFAFSSLVHPALKIPFLIFSGGMGICLTLPSAYNKKRRFWESIFLYIRSKKSVFVGARKGRVD